MNTVVCCIAKSENHYIREWVEYYKKLGFSNVIIYDNNDINGERFEDVICDYINNGFVIIRDVRGKQGYHQQAYQDCYNEFGQIYDWIAYFDVDEFLELDKKYKNVNEFLSEPFFEKAQVIRVSWKHFDDNDLICVVDGNYNIRDRFTREARTDYIENFWTKGILRGKLPSITISHCVDGAHLIKIKEVKFAVNCVGDSVDNNIFRNGICWKNAWLCHYRFKTMEEYVNKKKRGWTVEGYSKEFVDNLFNCDKFFEINKKTQEKIDLYYKLINNIDIFVFAHKNFETERKNPVYKIVCNKNDNVASDSLEVIKLDCELSNIGFSEWQKIYELYKQKQVELNNYVGLAHYHRFLSFGGDVNDVPEMNQFFKKYDVLDKHPINVGNLRKQYAACHNVNDFDLAFDILKEMHPELNDKIDKVVNDGVMFDSNIMILRKNDFISLCDFVFPVLFEYCNRVGIDRTSDESFLEYKNKHITDYMKMHKQGDYNFDEQARICSYLAERLVAVFLFTKFSNIGILPMVEK